MFEYNKDNVKFQAKMRSDDRVLVLRRKEGVSANAANGLVDNRLFKDENKLHAIRDPQYGFWTFKYEKGSIPQSLHQRYMTFNDANEAATTYFNGRNVDVIDVYDCYD